MVTIDVRLNPAITSRATASGRGTQYSSWITRFPELTGVVVAVRRKHPASVARLAHRVAAATMR